MTVYSILRYPHGLLRRKSTPVEKFTTDLTAFAAGMIETMRSFDGIGLAAPQVGILKRIIVVDIEGYLSNPKLSDWHGSTKFFLNGKESALQFPLILVNPEIKESGELVVFPYDGCLSFPGASGYQSKRHRNLIVEAKSPANETLRIECDGILSVCLQHEIDHIDGVLFVDRLVEADFVEEIAHEVKAAETDSSYRKLLRKLHPVDARQTAWDFL